MEYETHYLLLRNLHILRNHNYNRVMSKIIAIVSDFTDYKLINEHLTINNSGFIVT